MAENASVENSPMALITMSAPAYQRRWGRSKCGAGAAAIEGTDDLRVARKSRRRLKLLASSAPAVTAARRSCSEKCMKSSSRIRRACGIDRRLQAAIRCSVVACGSVEVHLPWQQFRLATD